MRNWQQLVPVTDNSGISLEIGTWSESLRPRDPRDLPSCGDSRRLDSDFPGLGDPAAVRCAKSSLAGESSGMTGMLQVTRMFRAFSVFREHCAAIDGTLRSSETSRICFRGIRDLSTRIGFEIWEYLWW